MEFNMFGGLPNVHKGEAYRRGWRFFTYRDSDFTAFKLCLTRCVQSDSMSGWSWAQHSVRVPVLSFRTAYRFRRFGGFFVYRLQNKILRRIWG